jgi:hypothetical protein
MQGLDLPPPFHLVTLREMGDAFAHAKTIAATAGAGTLIRVGRFDRAEFALVLEPEEPLWSARRFLYAGLLALSDALSAYAPPHRPIGFIWPDAILVNGGLVGAVRFAWPADAPEDEPPEWLVFGGILHRAAMGERPPGVTTLEVEGFDDVDSGQLVEACARHLLTALDAWQPEAFRSIAKRYLRQLTHEKGRVPAIDDTGDLLIQRAGLPQPERRALATALVAADGRSCG